MAEDKKYNGWTNYETWNVALWLGNDSGSQERCEELTQAAWNDAEADKTFTREERATLDLADALKAEIEEFAPDLGASMFSDLLSAALGEVNWYEIAEHYIADLDKTSDEDEAEAE